MGLAEQLGRVVGRLNLSGVSAVEHPREFDRYAFEPCFRPGHFLAVGMGTAIRVSDMPSSISLSLIGSRPSRPMARRAPGHQLASPV
jgi:hypothetical protein